MDDLQFAFMNESGNYGFDFENNKISTHFIIACVLVKETRKNLLEMELETIREKYFQDGEMSSAKVHSDEVRIQLLNELNDLPFTIYAYVVDKRKIREDSGITYKKTFFRYLNRMMYEDLSRTFDQLDLAAADNGTKEFMDEFKRYVINTSIPDLFQYSLFGFNQSQSGILLQLADLIAGTIAKGYDQTQYSKSYSSFYQILKNKMIAINLWPYNYKHFLYDYKSYRPDSAYDDVIIKQSVNLTYQYMGKNRKSEEVDEKIRIDFLKFLLFNLKENPDEYVYTQEILDNLNAIREPKINQHYFRSNIVSKLRDSGLLISSSNKGYKLPVCLADLYEFVNLSSLTIRPMIQRIAKCRDQILMATNREVDILNQKEYEYLKKMIEMEKISLHEAGTFDI